MNVAKNPTRRLPRPLPTRVPSPTQGARSLQIFRSGTFLLLMNQALCPLCSRLPRPSRGGKLSLSPGERSASAYLRGSQVTTHRSRPSCAKVQKLRFVSPLFATLTDSLSRKSFPCHSYANTRDGGATPPPIFTAGSKYRRKSFRIRSYRKRACKSFRMRSYEIPPGVGTPSKW